MVGYCSWLAFGRLWWQLQKCLIFWPNKMQKSGQKKHVWPKTTRNELIESEYYPVTCFAWSKRSLMWSYSKILYFFSDTHQDKREDSGEAQQFAKSVPMFEKPSPEVHDGSEFKIAWFSCRPGVSCSGSRGRPFLGHPVYSKLIAIEFGLQQN